jgi:hypothetical protein
VRDGFAKAWAPIYASMASHETLMLYSASFLCKRGLRGWVVMPGVGSHMPEGMQQFGTSHVW